MDEETSQDEDVVRAALLDQVLTDRQAGKARSLAEYQELFADHRELVAAELADLEASIATGAAGAVPQFAEPVPRALGPYRLVRELGRGGQGVVYLALDLRLRRQVALKVLPAAGLHAAELAQRFQREAEVASRLDHPGICTILEAGADGGVLYIAMRFVEGQTLAARIAAVRPHGDATGTAQEDLVATLEIFEKCARALHHAHEAGVIHRDIKPGNILIDRNGDPVILDFGLARDEDDLAVLTRTGELSGTPAYMAPEQVSTVRPPLDRRTDVYALGVSLYEAVTGHRPFDVPTREGLFHAILTSEPADPRRSCRAVSTDLKVVLETALAKERERRYQTAFDLAEDLRRIRCREPIRARPVTWLGRLTRWARRAPAAAALVGVLVLGLAALGALAGYVLANRQSLATGRQTEQRTLLEKVIDRGFTALPWNSAAAGAAFREALHLDPTSIEATVGFALQLLQPLRLVGGPGAETAGRQAGGAADALEFLDRQQRSIGRHPDLLRARLRCLEHLGDAPGIAALRSEIGGGQSVLGAIIEASRYWHLYAGMPPNGRATAELYRFASQACDLAPRPKLFYLMLRGAPAGDLRRWEEAERLANLILETWPDDTDAMLGAGTLFSVRTPRGRELLEEVVRLRPDHAGAWAFLAVNWARNDRERAVRYLQRALTEIGGADWWISGRLGVFLLTCDRPQEALAVFENAFGRDGSPQSLVGRGLARQALGDLAGAEADFRATLGRLDGYTGGAWMLGRLLAETGRAEEAIGHLRQAVGMDDREGRLCRMLADVLQLAGRHEEARSVLVDATQRLPDDRGCWNSLAWLLVDPATPPEHRSPDLAVFAARHALALGKEAAHVLNTLGVALCRRGDHQEAIDVLRRAQALEAERGRPEPALVLAFLAVAQAKLGHHDDATQALARARTRLAALPDERGELLQEDRQKFPWNVPLRTDAAERSAAAAVAEAVAALPAAGGDAGR